MVCEFFNPLEEPLGPRPSLRALLHGQSCMSARNHMSSLCITAHSSIYSGEDHSQGQAGKLRQRGDRLIEVSQCLRSGSL